MTIEVNAAIDTLNKAFADFKTEHTKQLDDIRKGLPSADQAAKVDKIGAHVDQLQKEVEDAHVKLAAGQMGAPGAGPRDQAYTDAFMAHMKKGDVQAALNKGADTEGGYLTPTEWDRTITDKLVLVSPMRQLATVQTISTNSFTKLFNLGGANSGWVGETAARPNTNTGTFASLAYGTGEIYANPAAPQQILDDAEINLESWLAGEVQAEFARQ